MPAPKHFAHSIFDMGDRNGYQKQTLEMFKRKNRRDRE